MSKRLLDLDDAEMPPAKRARVQAASGGGGVIEGVPPEIAAHILHFADPTDEANPRLADNFWYESFSAMSRVCKSFRDGAIGWLNDRWHAPCVAVPVDAQAAAEALESGGLEAPSDVKTHRYSMEEYLRTHLAGLLDGKHTIRTTHDMPGIMARLEPEHWRWSKSLIAFYALVVCGTRFESTTSTLTMETPPEKRHFGLVLWRDSYPTTYAPNGPLRDYLKATLVEDDPRVVCVSKEAGILLGNGSKLPVPPVLNDWSTLEWILVRMAWRGAFAMSAVGEDPEAHDLLVEVLFHGLMETLALNDPLRLPVFLIALALRMPLRPIEIRTEARLAGSKKLVKSLENRAVMRITHVVAAMCRAVTPHEQGEAWMALHGDATGVLAARGIGEGVPSYGVQRQLRARFAEALNPALDNTALRTVVGIAVARGELWHRIVAESAGRRHDAQYVLRKLIAEATARANAEAAAKMKARMRQAPAKKEKVIIIEITSSDDDDVREGEGDAMDVS